MSDRVLLTGITGYIGQHCAATLLNGGYEVIGTVRSQAKASAAREALGQVAPVDNLQIVEADLLSDDGWDAAAEGCTYALHVASPFFLSEPEDENEFITPAVEGTKRVVGAAVRAGVKRLVLTSSVASVSAGHGSGTFGADSWSDTDGDIGAYSKSKTLAERAAWDMVQGAAMELTTINPAAVLGPSLGGNPDAQSVALMTEMITGKMPMFPDLSLGVVDVRDVAELHVKAMTAEGAAGKRFIASTSEPISMGTLAEILRNAGFDKAPKRKAPTPLLRVMALFDKDVKAMLPLLGTQAAFDNSAAVQILGWKPIPFEESVIEMAQAIQS